MNGRDMLLVGLALAGGGLITLALLTGRGATASEAIPAAVSPDLETAAAAAISSAPAAPRWHDKNRDVWLGRGNRGIAYEVPADNTVGVWMRTVRPVLVVRCRSGSTEVFVVTDSAAQIEPQTSDHTVAYSFDGQPVTKERWPDSAEHDALFAPDGKAFAARVNTAQLLEFRFTPHNAPAVTARFQVTGLAPLLQPAAKACGF